MNLNLYKEYRFALSKFISRESGKEYEFDMEDDDRFYIYMKPHITKGKVEGLTEVMIDELIITDPDKTFFDEKFLTLDTKILVTTKQDFIYGYTLIIKEVKVIDASVRKYENDEWVIKSCKLRIPYQTVISVTEAGEKE